MRADATVSLRVLLHHTLPRGERTRRSGAACRLCSQGLDAALGANRRREWRLRRCRAASN